MSNAATKPDGMPESVTGVHLMQGIGHQEAKGFWTEAWMQVLGRRGALAGLAWVATIAFFAVFAPIIANGHPMLMWNKMPDGSWGEFSSPLFRFLRPSDVLLIIGGVLVVPWILLPLPGKKIDRMWAAITAALQAGIAVVIAGAVAAVFNARDASDWMRTWEQSAKFIPIATVIIVLCSAIPFVFIGPLKKMSSNILLIALVAVVSASVIGPKWRAPLEQYNYWQRAAAGEIRTIYTVIPFGPNQGETLLFSQAPMTTVGKKVAAKDLTEADAGRRYLLGTDGFGQDVLSQILHACRLSISIGLVSTGIAVSIGVTVGALMGYFGGWVDLLLYRVVEVFMAVPVLFLLIVAAGVLPRNTYVMMAIIGCFTWPTAARFTRAEFMKLRNQDFVQSAKSVGLPLRSILFKHMLPNGVTPVLVDASFLIAAAILTEAVLSFLALGPAGQASWGKLLNSATGEAGTFLWWLAIFPGGAIFLTVLAYNLIGEALRDAIDPKLKKARV
jgi:peptide/nickel transport system permease protein